MANKPIWAASQKISFMATGMSWRVGSVKVASCLSVCALPALLMGCVETMPLQLQTAISSALSSSATPPLQTQVGIPSNIDGSRAINVGEPASNGALRVNATANDIGGRWSGIIDCGTGPANLRFTVTQFPGGPNMVGGLVILRPVSGGKPEYYSFGFRGEIRQGLIRIRADDFEKKAKSFPKLDFDASIYGGPDRISGNFLAGGCTPLELHRPGSVFDDQKTSADSKKLLSSAQPAQKGAHPLKAQEIKKLVGNMQVRNYNSAKTSAALLGQPVELVLNHPNGGKTESEFLYVPGLVGIEFTCKDHPNGFQRGKGSYRISTKISKFGIFDGPEGDPYSDIQLEQCK